MEAAGQAQAEEGGGSSMWQTWSSPGATRSALARVVREALAQTIPTPWVLVVGTQPLAL